IHSTCFRLGTVVSQPKARSLEFTVSPDEKWAAAVFNNDEVRWARLQTGSKALSFRERLMLSASFSRDGKTLGIATADLEKRTAKITFLDVETGRERDEWNLDPVETWSVAHTPDWQTVCQAGGDAEVHV